MDVIVRKIKRHITAKHTSFYNRKFKCDVCAKEFVTNDQLKDHTTYNNDQNRN